MSGNNEEVSLQDEIRAAFEADASKEQEVKPEEAAKPDGAEESKPEEAAKPEPEVKTEPEAKPDATGKEPEVKLTDAKAPSSWSPKARERWGELPEDIRQEITRREEASANGVRKLQEDYAPIKTFVDSISPFLQEAAQLGQNPAQHVHNVLATERALRSQDPQQRFQALLSVADTYGIPLRQFLNLPANQQQPQVHIPPEVARELQEARAFREQFSASSIEREVTTFKDGKEFFEDVREIMADLMDAGQAKGLQDAYDKAIWMSPTVREVLIARQSGQAKEDELRQRQAKAAGAAVNTQSNADVTVDTDDDDSTEAIVRRAMKGTSGRV